MRTRDYSVDDVEHFAKYFAVLVYDPKATRQLHFQCSSFYWSDEMPEFVDDGYDASIRHFMLYLFSYRKMLMYGEAVPVFDPLWGRLKERCPNWPGFRSERRDVSLIPDVEREFDKELERLGRAFDVCKRRREHRAKVSAKREQNRSDS